MWTAKLLNAVDRDTHWKIVVEFTDGTDTKKEGYRFTGTTAKELKDFVRGKAAAFERNDVSLDLLPLIGQSIDVTPPTPPEPPTPPTQAELDARAAEAAWFDDWRKLNQLREVLTAVPALADPAANALVASLEASLEAGWLNSYLEKI